LFAQGQIYRRRDLHTQFGGQQRGGISTPAKHPLILMFTSESGEQFGYRDGWNPGGLFYYTGEGQSGDMRMDKGNLAIARHVERGKDLHLFEQERKAFVRYVGQFVCVGSHTERTIGADGIERDAIVFELLPIQDLQDQAGNADEEPATSGNGLGLEQLRRRAMAEPPNNGDPQQRSIAVRNRSRNVKLYVLARAAGNCEGCRQPAPFMTASGTPYLEPHHTHRLSDGGPDNVAWVIAVCPTCHRRAHYAVDAEEFNERLKATVNAIEKATVGVPTT
jgi:5-methylcytosine-specific restriction protein A